MSAPEATTPQPEATPAASSGTNTPATPSEGSAPSKKGGKYSRKVAMELTNS